MQLKSKVQVEDLHNSFSSIFFFRRLSFGLSMGLFLFPIPSSKLE